MITKDRHFVRGARVAASLLLLCLVLVLVSATAASASTSYAIPGLSVQPKNGAFGHVSGVGCDFSTVTGRCEAKTFTFANVGSEPILFNAMAIADPTDQAWGILAAGTTCDALPIE